MAPKKRKAEKTAVTAATSGRATRSTGRTTRSSPNPKLVELPDTRKSPAKKKAKKADAKRKGKAKAKEVKQEVKEEDSVSEDEKVEGEASENGQEDPNKTVIVIEYCKQCSSFKTRANQVKIGLEQSEVNVVVKLNPEKPRKGCFEIREEGEGGRTFVSLLDMQRPFKPMKDLDMKQVILDIIDQLSNANGL